MFGPVALTHFVYAAIALSLLAAFGFAVWLSVRDKRKQQQLEQRGFRPHSIQEAILVSQNALDGDDRRDKH